MLPNKTRFRRRYLTAMLFVCVALTLGCAKGVKLEPANPWEISPDAFHRRVKVLALTHVTLPDGLPDPKAVSEQFDALIEERLRGSGLSIVRPEDYKSAWERAAAEIGGLERADGQRDDVQVTKAAVRTMLRLKAEFPVDAVMIPTVDVVEARFASGRAQWDGATQTINTSGPVQSFFSGSPDGVVPALSLVVRVYAPDGELLYRNAGGIEVLNKMSGKEFILVPRQELFQDADHIETAVRTALEPLHRR